MNPWRSILLPLATPPADDAPLQAARALAQWFDADVVGLAGGAGAPMPLDAELGWRDRAEALIRASAARDAAAAEALFQERLAGVRSTYRFSAQPLREAVLTASRAADVIVAPFEGMLALKRHRGIRAADLVLHAGRPVLLVPAASKAPDFRQIVLGWKDCREARRALVDALPLLARAKQVHVVHVAEPGSVAPSDLGDLIGFLTAHGVPAQDRPVEAGGASVAEHLHRVADETGSDLIVGGFLSRGRVREALLGGVTRDLLRRPERYLFVTR